jgi:hypothetical protein
MIRVFGLHLSGLCLFLIVLSSSSAYSQQAIRSDFSASSPLVSYPVEAEENPAPPLLRPSSALIISSFIATETRFRETLVQFSFKRDVVLQTIGAHGEVTGEYIRNSVFVLDDRGERIERMLYHPKPSISEIRVTKEDIQDLAGSQLFGLDIADLNSYNLSYVGEENLDGRPLYIVEVNPKREPDPFHMRLRFFVGRIWIDPVSFQIVKLRGITEPHGRQRFPFFQTERELKVENLRFPSAAFADDVLHFHQKDVHYRIKVRYYDFKRFVGRLRIVEAD